MCICIHSNMHLYIYTPFLTSLFTLLSEKTKQKNQNGSSHRNQWRKQGCWLTDSWACFWAMHKLVCEKGVCLCRGSEGGSKELALPTAGLGSFSSFSRVPASLCPLISRPFIAFVYYLLDFMMALWPDTLLAWNCLWHWYWVWDE